MTYPDFRPPGWLKNRHLQTLKVGYWPGPVPAETAVKHQIGLPDGDALVLHENCPTQFPADGQMALLLHGLSGCHASPYMLRTAAKLVSRGVCVFRLDMRGCGDGAALAKHTAHAGRSGDVLAAAQFILARNPQASLTLVGFSLGAAMALKTMGEFAKELPENLDGAIVVSPPIDLMSCCQRLQQGIGKLYDRQLARWLYRHVEQRRHLNEAIAHLDVGPRPRSVMDFDAKFTAPLGGFDSVEHYYHDSSAQRVMAEIRRPVLILTSVDDPVVPFDTFDDAPLSNSTRLCVTQHGGHLGFYAAAGPDPDRWWMDWRVVDFVASDKRSRPTAVRSLSS